MTKLKLIFDKTIFFAIIFEKSLFSFNFEENYYNMYEKILQKLKLQRGTTSNVSDRTLEDLAKSLVAIISTDEILAVADFTASIASLDGNINNYTAEQIKKIDSTKQTEEAKKAKEEADRLAAEEAAKKAGISPEIAALIEQIKQIMATLSGLQTEKAVSTRKQMLEEKLKATPDLFKATVLKSFERTTFKDDDDFNSYLTEMEVEGKKAIQEGQEKGLNFSSPGAVVVKSDSEGISPEMEKTLKEMTEVKEIKKPF